MAPTIHPTVPASKTTPRSPPLTPDEVEVGQDENVKVGLPGTIGKLCADLELQSHAIDAQLNDLHSSKHSPAPAASSAGLPSPVPSETTDRSPECHGNEIDTQQASKKRKRGSDHENAANASNAHQPDHDSPPSKKRNISGVAQKVSKTRQPKEDERLIRQSRDLELLMRKEEVSIAAKAKGTNILLKKSIKAMKYGPKAITFDQIENKKPLTSPPPGATLPTFWDPFARRHLREQKVEVTVADSVSRDSPNDPDVREVSLTQSLKIFQVTTVPRGQGGESAHLDKDIRKYPTWYPHIWIEDDEGKHGTIYIRKVSPEDLKALREQAAARDRFMMGQGVVPRPRQRKTAPKAPTPPQKPHQTTGNQMKHRVGKKGKAGREAAKEGLQDAQKNHGPSHSPSPLSLSSSPAPSPPRTRAKATSKAERRQHKKSDRASKVQSAAS